MEKRYVSGTLGSCSSPTCSIQQTPNEDQGLQAIPSSLGEHVKLGPRNLSSPAPPRVASATWQTQVLQEKRFFLQEIACEQEGQDG